MLNIAVEHVSSEHLEGRLAHIIHQSSCLAWKGSSASNGYFSSGVQPICIVPAASVHIDVSHTAGDNNFSWCRRAEDERVGGSVSKPLRRTPGLTGCYLGGSRAQRGTCWRTSQASAAPPSRLSSLPTSVHRLCSLKQQFSGLLAEDIKRLPTTFSSSRSSFKQLCETLPPMCRWSIAARVAATKYSKRFRSAGAEDDSP